MILFIFEGDRETKIYDAMEYVFFGKKDASQRIISCYNGNIYDLYSKFVENGGDMDLIALLRERYNDLTKCPIPKDMKRSDFAEVYLFFDYDFHHNADTTSVEELNKQVQEMLCLFDNETENGKLYISYPMVEAIRHTKQLPDNNYHTYTISREESKQFKKMVGDFSFYKNHKFICTNERDTTTHQEEVRTNWKMLIEQNVTKAHWLCNDSLSLPDKYDDEFQKKIFQEQIVKFVTQSKCVSVLSAYPLFLFDYFGRVILSPAQ